LTLLTDELKQWIGREFNYVAPEEIGRASIRYFALAIGDDNRLYFDDGYARTAGYSGIIAPPTFVCETNQYAHRQPNPDGYIGHSWDLPLSRCRMIRGGHQYEFFQPVKPEDRIHVKWRLEDMSEHSSSRGGALLIVVAAGTYSNQREEMLAHNRETLIFQELGEVESVNAGAAASVPLLERQKDPRRSVGSSSASGHGAAPYSGLHVGAAVPTLERQLDLVRMIAYAGATWDWARLHYDPVYVAERKLPAPVIDGQMLGALLSEALLDWLGPRGFIRELNFRLRAMAFAGETVQCDGEVTALESEAQHSLITVTQRVCVGDRLIANGGAIVRVTT
jgi:acyl dehydratase